VPFRAAPAIAPGAPGVGFQAVKERSKPHDSTLHFGSGLRYNGDGNHPGAQTERRGDAGPVRGLLGGKDPTGRLSYDFIPSLFHFANIRGDVILSLEPA
jgi:hypothetical protein